MLMGLTYRYEERAIGRHSSGSRRLTRFRGVLVLSRVEIEDLTPLPGPRVDSANVLSAFHFPDGSDDTVFFYGLIGNFVFR